MTHFAKLSVLFVCIFVSKSCLGYTPYREFWDGEPLTCVNKEFMHGHPRIKGPKSTADRIAIVGAGAAGMQMAYELKRRGFNNIVIFESRKEVGGKVTSRLYRNVWQELGAVGLTETYDKTVELLERFNVGFEVRPEVPSNTWLTRNEYKPTLETIPIPLSRVLEAGQRYITLHRCLFGTYEGELMPRPSPEIRRKIRGTIEDFLQRYNLTDLTPLFNIAIVLNGYGFLNETSALYALTFVPPAAVESFMKPERGAYRLFGGWQNLFLEMAKQIKVNIIYNANIKQITRRKTVQIVFNQSNSKQLRIQNFDFLILTPAMNSLFNVVDFNHRELAIFSHLRNTYYLKTIVNSISPGKRALSPLEIFQYDINDVEYAVYRSINLHQANNNITGLDYQLGLKENVDPDGSKYETSIYVQFGKANPWNPDVDEYIQRLIGKHLQDFNKAKPQVVEQVKWGYYFPNFPPEAITGGALWDILDMQGQYNTWYIGSSVLFESLESVFEYNLLILKLFRKLK